MAPVANEALAKFILTVALSDASPASNPVLQAIFAIASLRLQGHSRGFHHKAHVVSILRESVTKLDRDSLLRNLTATMLLYQYEVGDRLRHGMRSLYLTTLSFLTQQDRLNTGHSIYVVLSVSPKLHLRSMRLDSLKALFCWIGYTTTKCYRILA